MAKARVVFAILACSTLIHRSPASAADLVASAAARPRLDVFLRFERHEGEKAFIKCFVVNAGSAAVAVGVQPEFSWDSYDSRGRWNGRGGALPEEVGAYRRYVFLAQTPNELRGKHRFDGESCVRLLLIANDLGKVPPMLEFRVHISLKVLGPDARSTGLAIGNVEFVGTVSGAKLWTERVSLRQK